MTEQDLQSYRAVPGFSIATIKLINELSDGKVGDILDDSQLSKTCALNCGRDGKGRPYVLSAIKHVERVKGIIWRRIWKTGTIKCLGTNECVEVALGYRKRISRSAKRAARIMSNVSIEEIDMKERSGVLALAAQIGALATFSSMDTQRQLAAKNVQEAPSGRQLLEALIGAKSA